MDHLLPGGRHGQGADAGRGAAGVPFDNSPVGLFPTAQARMVAAGGGDHRGQAPVAAREQGLDHAPAVALRPQLDALGLEPFGEQLQPFFSLGAHPLPLEGGVGLGHKGAHS